MEVTLHAQMGAGLLLAPTPCSIPQFNRVVVCPLSLPRSNENRSDRGHTYQDQLLGACREQRRFRWQGRRPSKLTESDRISE